MKKLLFIITCFLILAGSGAWGNSELNQLHVNWVNNEVVLKADLSGAFQFSHEIAEAKNGKPYRVVIDLFPAVHNLSQKDYAKLPSSIVKSIRTSQFSTNPDQISRIVLDLDNSAVYRIKKKANSVYIYIPDSKCQGFSSWSSPLKVKSIEDKSTVAKTERKAESKTIVASKPVEKKAAVQKKVDNKPVKEVKKVVKQPEPPKYTYSKPAKSNDFDRQFAFKKNQWASVKSGNEKKSAINTEPVIAKTASKVSSSKPKKTESKKVVAKVETKKKAKDPVVAKVDPAPEKNSQISKPKYSYNKPESSSVLDKDRAVDKSAAKSLAVKDEPAKKESKSVEKPVSNNFKKVKKSELADSGTKAKLSTKDTKEIAAVSKTKKATSRFRRKPAFPTKLKGTIVAQFPTRMVIKYKPSSLRDPFATLISERASSSDLPMGRRIADVETSRLVGVLESSDGKNSALLEDMDGIGYILNSGDKVKKGYVSKIYADKALFQLFEYGWSRTVALRLNNGE